MAPPQLLDLSTCLPSALNSHSSRITKRKQLRRVKKACDRCRDLKRKCDGKCPCVSCFRSDQACNFEVNPPVPTASRSYSVLQSPATDITEPSTWSGIESATPISADQRLNIPSESNILHALSVKTGLALSSIPEPTMLDLQRPITEKRTGSPVGHVLTGVDTLQMCNNGFDMFVEPFKFLQRQDFTTKLLGRYQSGAYTSSSDTLDYFDAVVCGMVLLGSLFSGFEAHPHEVTLLEHASLVLEKGQLSMSPSVDLITGWLLRTMYFCLRQLSLPAWLSSCTTIHVMDALHDRNATALGMIELGASVNFSHLAWTAKFFNSYLSFKCGKPQINDPETQDILQGKTAIIDQLARMCSIYESFAPLSPKKAWEPFDFEQFVCQIESISAAEPLRLLNTVLVLETFSNSYYSLAAVSNTLKLQIVSMGQCGLVRTRNSSVKQTPCWPVGNISYWFLCILLDLESPESLALVGPTLETLQLLATGQVSSPPICASNVFEVSQNLVRLFYHRKIQNASCLQASLNSTNLQHLLINSESTPLPSGDIQQDESALSTCNRLDFDNLDICWGWSSAQQT